MFLQLLKAGHCLLGFSLQALIQIHGLLTDDDGNPREREHEQQQNQKTGNQRCQARRPPLNLRILRNTGENTTVRTPAHRSWEKKGWRMTKRKYPRTRKQIRKNAVANRGPREV